MKITQLSVFLENKPGRLSEPCKVLAEAGISIVTLSLADTEQFGILRLIVEDWPTARKALADSGAVVNATEVVATEVEDRPGGLADLLTILEKGGVNIEYMYAFTFGRQDRAVLIFRFEDPDAAIEVLQGAGVNVIDHVGLFGSEA
jgi:hypothetical protein